MKLNLGSGNDYKKGWVNLDYNKLCNPDIVWDITKLPLPFKDNEFDEIIMIHVLEHFYNPIDIINELWRISKPNAKITIKVLHWSCHFAYGDLTHKSYYSSRSFMHFNDSKDYYNSNTRFEITRKLNGVNIRNRIGAKIWNLIFNPILNFSYSLTENFFCKILPIYENIYKLKVIKEQK